MRVFLLQAIHALYIVQGVNGHAFLHNDFRAINMLIRRREEAQRLPYFTENGGIKEVIVPSDVELVISDFGRSTLPGLLSNFYPTFKNFDISEILEEWLEIYKWKKWERTELTEVKELFTQNNRLNVPFETVLNCEYFKGFEKSFCNDRPLFISPPVPSQIKEITLSKIRKETTNVMDRIDQNPKETQIILDEESQIRTILEGYGNSQRYLLEFRNKEDGLIQIVERLPISSERKKFIKEKVQGLTLSDFEASSDEEIKSVLADLNNGEETMLFYAIKNNLF